VDSKPQQSLLSPDEVAQLLGVTRKTVYRFAAAGLIASLRVGGVLRFSLSDLDRYLDSVRIETHPQTSSTLHAASRVAPAQGPTKGGDQ
jgi:excisionase family DNA binding protein